MGKEWIFIELENLTLSTEDFSSKRISLAFEICWYREKFSKEAHSRR